VSSSSRIKISCAMTPDGVSKVQVLLVTIAGILAIAGKEWEGMIVPDAQT
jgi:hypothetical protein